MFIEENLLQIHEIFSIANRFHYKCKKKNLFAKYMINFILDKKKLIGEKNCNFNMKSEKSHTKYF
jgi:hypothetical protein